MPDILESFPEDEGGERKDRIPPREDNGTSEIIGRLRKILAAKEQKGLLPVEIIGADAESPIMLMLPLSVAKVVLSEAEMPETKQSPSIQLARDYKEWEEETSDEVKEYGKGNATCFGMYGDPKVLFWTLEHFSDSDFPLNERQKADVIFHTLNHIDFIRRHELSSLMSTENKDSLEYMWYALVKLMAVEQRVLAKTPKGDQLKHHMGLIQSHYAWWLRDLEHHHGLGWITTESPKEDIEQKLLELVKSHPQLKPQVTYLLQHWNDLEQHAELLHQMNEERSDRLWGMGKEDPDDDEFADVAEEAEAQKRLLRKLHVLERAMTPEEADDSAWDHPLEYIEEIAEGRRAIFLSSGLRPSNDENFSNSQKFQFALLERIAEKGFTNWMWSKAENFLHPLQDWLKETGDSRSLKALQETMQEYMKLKRGNRIPALRNFLLMPHQSEPLQVTQCLRYWQEIWDLKEKVGAEVRLYQSWQDNERARAAEWMEEAKEGKFFCIGGRVAHCSTDESLRLRHSTAKPQYNWEKFMLSMAVPHAAHQVGKKRGWGVHQTSAMPVEGNDKFRQIFENGGELEDEATGFQASFKIEGGIHSVIFTEEEEEDRPEEIVEPSDADAGVPLVGAGR